MAATLQTSVIQASGSTTPNLTLDTAGNATVGNTLVMGSSFKRNRIINGNMAVDQRNAGASVTANNAIFPVDRFAFACSQTGKGTGQQNAGSVTPPTGFSNYLGFTSSSAYSVLTGDYFIIQQSIEGFNFSDLGFGSSSAKSVTLSFYVYSSITGTHSGAMKNYASSRSYPFTFTVSAANTWTYVTITIPGDTGGTWVGASNAGAALICFNFGTGSTYSGTAGAWASANYVAATGAVSIVGTNGATFYITGVQLEQGSVATPYERQIYSDQLAQCQRYLPFITTVASTTSDVGLGSINASNGGVASYYFKVTPRVPPTGITVTNVGSFSYTSPTVNATVSALSFSNGGLDCARMNVTGSTSSYTVANSAILYANGSATVGTIAFTGCEL